MRSSAGIALVVAALTACAHDAPSAHVSPAPRTAAPEPAPKDATPPEVTELLEALATFEPEAVGSMGLPGHEEDVAYIAPDYSEKVLARLRIVEASLVAAKDRATDKTTKQDLAITLKAARRYIAAEELERRRYLPYRNVAKTMFQGLLQHLRPGGRPERALARLKRYAEGFADRARARLASGVTRPDAATLLWPTKTELEQHLADADTYLAELETLFVKTSLEGWREPFAKTKAEVAAYGAYVRTNVLPRARKDFVLPPDVYEHMLREAGVEEPKTELATRARAAYALTKAEMQALAGSRDYRVVLREQRAKTLTGEALVGVYRERLADIEAIVRKEGLVTLPSRPVPVRLASKGETSQNPSPTIDMQALFKKDETLAVVIPLGGRPRAGETSAAYDDFAYPAVAWTLAAHEGRPGHEMQFSILKERGLSLPRTLFAFNSANVEGWGLYAESIIQPFMPADAKLASLRMRALREARAFLDPGLHDRSVSLDDARRVLAEELVFGDAVVREELDRYTFESPAQATAYFYGFEKLLALRAEASSRLGKRFDARAFHDAVLGAGLLPADLQREAVLESLGL